LTTTKKFDFWDRICYADSVKQNQTTEIIRELCFCFGRGDLNGTIKNNIGTIGELKESFK